MKDYKKREKIIQYIKYNPYLVCIDTTTGESHLELEFCFKDIYQLNNTMTDLVLKFPNSIKNYKNQSDFEFIKVKWYPSK